jgi:hypothetical protein
VKLPELLTGQIEQNAAVKGGMVTDTITPCDAGSAMTPALLWCHKNVRAQISARLLF